MKLAYASVLCLLVSPLLSAQTLKLDLDKSMPAIEKLYLDLHQSPELSYHEQQTGKKMASQLQKLGFDVTNSVGGYGVVGIYRNGQGPTVMIRTDTDALPITEQTGKAYASTVTTINKQGIYWPCLNLQVALVLLTSSNSLQIGETVVSCWVGLPPCTISPS